MAEISRSALSLTSCLFQREIADRLVTRATNKRDETKYKFTPFSERPEDKVVKAKMVEWDDRLKDVKFATVPDPYNDDF